MRHRAISRLTALTLSRLQHCIGNDSLIPAQNWTSCEIPLSRWQETTRSFCSAGAFFSNHYHLVASFENTKATHGDFVRHLHRELSMRLNRINGTSGRE